MYNLHVISTMTDLFDCPNVAQQLRQFAKFSGALITNLVDHVKSHAPVKLFYDSVTIISLLVNNN